MNGSGYEAIPLPETVFPLPGTPNTNSNTPVTDLSGSNSSSSNNLQTLALDDLMAIVKKLNSKVNALHKQLHIHEHIIMAGVDLEMALNNLLKKNNMDAANVVIGKITISRLHELFESGKLFYTYDVTKWLYTKLQHTHPNIPKTVSNYIRNCIDINSLNWLYTQQPCNNVLYENVPYIISINRKDVFEWLCGCININADYSIYRELIESICVQLLNKNRIDIVKRLLRLATQQTLTIMFEHASLLHNLEFAKWIYDKTIDANILLAYMNYLKVGSDCHVVEWMNTIHVELHKINLPKPTKEDFIQAVVSNRFELAIWIAKKGSISGSTYHQLYDSVNAWPESETRDTILSFLLPFIYGAF